MRPKKRLLVIVLLSALVGLYLVARVTGMLQFFNIPTAGNVPGINPGEMIWVSNLKSPKRYDFIVFNFFDPMMSDKKMHYVFRLCGMPGDTIEIRNGDLFVNNKNTSGLFDLCLPYKIASKDAATVNEVLKLTEDDLIFQTDTSEVYLTKDQLEQLKKLHIAVERKILPKEEGSEYIAKLYSQPWNPDHFGPFIVPADRYFVLGDNRHRAQDSRYTGPIPTSDFYGTVISK